MCECMQQYCNLRAQLSPRLSTGESRPHGLYHGERKIPTKFQAKHTPTHTYD